MESEKVSLDHRGEVIVLKLYKPPYSKSTNTRELLQHCEVSLSDRKQHIVVIYFMAQESCINHFKWPQWPQADMNSGCMPEYNCIQLLQLGSKYTHCHFEKPAPIFRQSWYLPTQDLCQQVVSQSPKIVGEVVQQGSDCLGQGGEARRGRGGRLC